MNFNKTMGFGAACLAAVSLVACAATGPAAYGPDDGKFGYSDTQIESDRYRIVYRGSGGMPPEGVLMGPVYRDRASCPWGRCSEVRLG